MGQKPRAFFWLGGFLLAVVWLHGSLSVSVPGIVRSDVVTNFHDDRKLKPSDGEQLVSVVDQFLTEDPVKSGRYEGGVSRFAHLSGGGFESDGTVLAINLKVSVRAFDAVVDVLSSELPFDEYLNLMITKDLGFLDFEISTVDNVRVSNFLFDVNPENSRFAPTFWFLVFVGKYLIFWVSVLGFAWYGRRLLRNEQEEKD